MSGISEQIRTVINTLNEPQPESKSVISRRRALRLFVWGGMGLAATALAGWSIHEQSAKQENPWKFEKLGPDEIYYYSGTMTVGPEETLFTAPLEDPHSFVVFMANGTYKTKNAPVILPEKGYDPKEHSSVGVITDKKGLLYATSQFVKIEGGSFRKARKTDKSNQFIDIETGAIIIPEAVKVE